MMHHLVSLLAASSLCLAAYIPIGGNVTMPHRDDAPVPGRGLRVSKTVGTTGESTFNDLLSIPPNPKLSKIIIQGDKTIEGLSIILDKGANLTHGSLKKTSSFIQPSPGDFITHIKLCWDNNKGPAHISQAVVDSRFGEHLEVGEETGNCNVFRAPEDYGIVGAHGQVEKDGITQLGFYYARAQKAGSQQ
ncbi:endonuclease/exonuclease/phosphatase family protein, putative, partial [Rhizoctonia solani AG-3 Rhs1AP]